MGSWRIRSQQLAAMRPAWTSAIRLEPDNILEHDVFVFVKRPERTKMRFLRQLGKVVVYDVLDCWKQPDDGQACDTMPKVLDFFARWFDQLPVDGVIFATQAMRDDLAQFVPHPITIYHHVRPGLGQIKVRPEVRVVGYEGEPSYLGEWRAPIEAACRRIGARFVVNPKDFLTIDVGFSARGGYHGSLMAHRYKSNVKLVNFVGAGIPCLVERSGLAYQETGNEHVRYFSTPDELVACLESLRPQDTRQVVHESFLRLREAYTIEAIANAYERYLSALLTECQGRPTDAGRCTGMTQR